ncbi:hypothetical protein TrRE_jg4593 [Triparma retinervis]|uniref:Uncharacterized protein n=1 Tax=Triparma retinervis TaxID=2557542 RepID=A0A9W6ZL09_9STRA|nr:hypothetical protein TrRE_jg4593 [Triparma retinervis]
MSKPNSSIAIRFIFCLIKYGLLSVPKSWNLHKMQSSGLARFRPGLWLHKLTGLRNNSCVRTMKLKASEVKEQAYFDLISTITSVKTNESSLTDDAVLTAADFYIPNANNKGREVKQIYFFTPNKQWLDVIEFTPQPSPDPDWIRFHVLSFSAGIVPASVPGSLFLSILLWFFAFSDVGQNYSHIKTVQKHLQGQIGEENVVVERIGGKKSRVKPEES